MSQLRAVISVVLLSFVCAAATSQAQGSARRTGPSEHVNHCWFVSPNYYLSTVNGYYKSSNGADWVKIHAPVNYSSLAVLPSGEIFVFSNDSYDVSTDGGAHWSTVPEADFSTRTVIVDSLGTMYAGENDPIYVSRDKAQTWTKTDAGASPNFFDVSVIVVAPDGMIYAGNQGITGGYVYRSTDHGATWKSIHSESMKDVSEIEVYPSGAIIISYSDHVLRSTNGGKSWSTITDPRQETYPRSAVFTDAMNGYAVTNGVVVRTVDGGVTWDSSQVLFERKDFTNLFRGPNNTLLASAATGLYMLVENAAVPTGSISEAEQPWYPNPSRSELKSELPASAHVDLYDAVGRIVSSNEMAGGTAMIDTHALPNGTYTVAVDVSGRIRTERVVVQH